MKPTFLEHPELASWYHDNFRMAKIRGNRWMVAAIFGWLIAASALVAFASVFPLTRIQPWLVTVDTTHGLVTSINPVEKGQQSLTEVEAIVQASLYRYVIACETYDPSFSFERGYGICRNMSESNRLKEFDTEISPDNPKSPINVIKGRGKRTVELISILPSSFEKDVAQVRFLTKEALDGTTSVERVYNAMVKYRFTSSPDVTEDRWENPLGFKVSSYRKDQEPTRSNN